MFKWGCYRCWTKTRLYASNNFCKRKKRIFDCKKFLFDEDYAKELKNIDLFMKAKAEHHTVMWTEDLDISPEYLYEKSVKEKNFA